ncbi:MAG: hypothetical protein KAX38_01120, partial [Candidatus Krumholzibacteria bacterium]|nr:hypothetical protein [Candidatus Krumholzibacteria bacterium]
LTHWIAVLLLGGDWMPHYRLLLPTIPLILLVVSSGLVEVGITKRDTAEPGGPEPGTRPGQQAETVTVPQKKDSYTDKQKWSNPVPVVVLIIMFLAMAPGGTGYDNFTAERVVVRAFARLGQHLHEILPPGTRIACGSTGAIGYYSDMPIIDILGLTESHIARHGHIVASQPGHMKTDGRYVLERKPDLLLLGNIQIHRGRRGKERMKHKVQESEIIIQPEFLKNYEFVNIPLRGNFYLSCYKRKGYFLPLE